MLAGSYIALRLTHKKNIYVFCYGSVQVTCMHTLHGHITGNNETHLKNSGVCIMDKHKN